jgi:O-6-methylguanine DNA methyltransferase
MRIVYHMASSPVGLLFIARTPRGLRHLEFMDRRSLKRAIAAHESEHPGAEWVASLLELKPVVEQLESYFNGGLLEFEIPLDLAGSDFQLKVWTALRSIPFGETRTYGQIAAAVGQPRATRAVGLANNQNPIAVVVPCHRVIGADGSLTGYGGGMPKKRWLLEHEATHARRLGLQGALAASGRTGARRAKR